METKTLNNHDTPPAVKPLLCEVLTKTRKCDWCDKRKLVEQGYWLGKFKNGNKDWFICRECNLKHDVV
jgi:hypothetical protein